MEKKRRRGFIRWHRLRPSENRDSSPPRIAPSAVTFWDPLSLRKRTLLILSAIFLSLGVALGVLAWYSNSNNGIGTASLRDQYVWTYGPTAVFTLAAVFWGETEYRAKQLQPWINLRAGWTTASQSVLLDYISPWKVAALVQAVPRGHIVAILGVLGSLVLQLVIVFSTGLFALQNISIENNHAPLVVKEAFAVSNPEFWEKQASQSTTVYDFRPTTVVIAAAEGNTRLQQGTTSREAFQQFHLPDTSAYQALSIRASVDVFESSLECETATFHGEWTWFESIDDQPTYNATSVSSESCKNATPSGVDWIAWPWQFDNGTLYSSYSVVGCAESSNADAMNDKRVLFYLGHLIQTEIHRVLNSTGASTPTNSTNGTNFAYTTLSPHFTALICYPKYGIYHAPVTVDEEGKGAIESQITHQGAVDIPGLAAWDLAGAFLNSLYASEYFIYAADTTKTRGRENWTVYTNEGAPTTQGGYFWELLNIVNPQPSVLNWMDTNMVNETLQSVWSQWSSQMAAFQLKTPASHAITGTVILSQNRLVVQPLAFWMIESGLLIAIIAAAALIAFGPKDVLPRDPTALGGLAAILASSKDFSKSLTEAWRYAAPGLREKLELNRFSARLDPRDSGNGAFSLSISQNPASKAEPGYDSPIPNQRSWWRPVAFSKWYMAGAPLLILALISLLEGLYQLSKQKNGIVSVTNSYPTRYIHFAWTLIPASVMTLTATTIGMLNFALQTLQPYRLLKRGSAHAHTGMFRCPYSVIDAFRYRDFATILTATSVFLAYFLTIAVSGLYSARSVLVTESIALEQTGWFAHNTSRYNASPLDIEAVTVGNLSYPVFTYEDLVFPALKAPKRATGKVNALVPALQGVMNCSVFPSDGIVSINNTWFNGYGWQDIISILIENQENCLGVFMTSDPLAPPDCKDSSCTALPTGNKILIDMQDLPATFQSVGDFKVQYLHMPATGYFGYVDWRKNRPNCPHVVGIIGRSANHLIEESTLFTCSPFVRGVQVNATFQLPAMDIDKSAPPVIIRDNSEQFKIKFAPPYTHGPFTATFGNPMLSFEEILLPPIKQDELFGTFMDVIVYGTQGIPAAELVGPANVQRLFSAVDSLYGIGTAQLMNKFRQPFKASPILINATRSFQGSFRLVQSEISTRILEGLLAAILICMLLAFLLMDTRKVLKHNPCSIAGMASLLAGSELLANIPEGAEWWSDEELIKHPTFDGWVFSLGWWPGSRGEKRFGVDIGRADRKPE